MFEGKKISLKLSEEAAYEYDFLKEQFEQEIKKGTKTELQSIFRAVERVRELLKTNPFEGDQVKKRLIPQYYRQKYGITNCWRIELPSFWRLTYTIKSEQYEIIILVLNIFDHKKYDKIFGYK
ncbi:hypothetical protein HZA97_02080 [Candidatus Woesearchaeota archaeon]|nr:hypothetical protein [Candidatus Woesearchaeota archaeon]